MLLKYVIIRYTSIGSSDRKISKISKSVVNDFGLLTAHIFVKIWIYTNIESSFIINWIIAQEGAIVQNKKVELDRTHV